MARDAKVWDWYAKANDSMRHALVEQAWFNQQETDAAFERDVTRMAERDIHGNEPSEAGRSVYGTSPAPTPNVGQEPG